MFASKKFSAQSAEIAAMLIARYRDIENMLLENNNLAAFDFAAAEMFRRAAFRGSMLTREDYERTLQGAAICESKLKTKDFAISP